MSADISFLCWCWSFQMPSRGHYASYSISIVGCCSECYPSKPISTWSASTYRRSRSLSLSLLPYPPSNSLSVTNRHKTNMLLITVIWCGLSSFPGDSGFIQTWLWGMCGPADWWCYSVLGLWSDCHWSHPRQQWVICLILYSSLHLEIGQLGLFVCFSFLNLLFMQVPFFYLWLNVGIL